MKTKRLMILIFTILALFMFMVNVNVKADSNTNPEPLENDVEVEPETNLIYYLDVTYDGVDKYGTESSNAATARVKSGYIYVEDKIPEGLNFVGFVTTENGSIGAVSRTDGSACSGSVVDDTKEESNEGLWINENTEFIYHGLHYTVADRTVRFKVKNLQAGGKLTVGIITETPTVDDPNTTVVEKRRDFYNFASALENALTVFSNMVHAYMGDKNATLYNVRYEYTGDVPSTAPIAPTGSSYVEGAVVGVAAPVSIEGYTFSGWSSSSVTIENNSFNMPSNEVVLTGSFTAIDEEDKYKVTYQLEGDVPDGYVLPLEKEYYKGQTVTVDSLAQGDVFGKYIFSGWETDDAIISEDNDFIMGEEDVILKGKFELIKYTVEYRFYDTVLPPNSDNYLPETKQYAPGTTVTLETVADPDGYEFLGWYEDDSFTMPEKNVVIYGEWRKINGTFEPKIEIEIIDKKEIYRAGDVVEYKITVTNQDDFALTDVIVKENSANMEFKEDAAYTKETSNFATIANMEPNGVVYLYASYTVTDDDTGEILNEVEIKGALAENDYVLAKKEYKDSCTFIASRDYVITAEVEKHDEERTNETTGNKEIVSVAGGSITNSLNTNVADGEDVVLVEEVEVNKSSRAKVTIIPDEGYVVSKISLVSTADNGTKTTTVVYGENSDENAEISYIKNNDGTITLPAGYFKNIKSDKRVIAEFKRVTARLMVNYKEKTTNKNVALSDEITGFIGDKYVTQVKEIPYYELIKEELQKNAEGKFENEDSAITYWYRKLLFNMNIKKEFTSVQVNGKEVLGKNNKLVKIDISNTKLNSTSIRVKYKIAVTNTEEIAGSAKILEQIPEGFKFVNSDVDGWKLSTESESNVKNAGEKYELTTKELESGETIEYEVILEWNKNVNCIGNLENMAKIVEVENEPDFEETTLDDNKDACMLIISVKTGENRDEKNIVLISCVVLVGICILVYIGAVIYFRRKR